MKLKPLVLLLLFTLPAVTPPRLAGTLMDTTVALAVNTVALPLVTVNVVLPSPTMPRLGDCPTCIMAMFVFLS